MGRAARASGPRGAAFCSLRTFDFYREINLRRFLSRVASFRLRPTDGAAVLLRVFRGQFSSLFPSFFETTNRKTGRQTERKKLKSKNIIPVEVVVMAACVKVSWIIFLKRSDSVVLKILDQLN